MFEKVVEIISEKLSVDADTIRSESSFLDDLGADSLDLVELVMALEDELGCSISTETIEGFNTVGDVVSYLEIIE